MTSQPKNDKTLKTGLGLMFLLVLVLGLRSERTVSTVLAMDAAAAPEAVRTATGDMDLEGLDARDRLIEEARPVRRDPFLKRERPEAPEEDLPVEIKEVLGPSLGALLYDNVNPSAQISIEGERSDWLRQGDEFKGWTVKSIRPDSVTITKGRETIVLS